MMNKHLLLLTLYLNQSSQNKQGPENSAVIAERVSSLSLHLITECMARKPQRHSRASITPLIATLFPLIWVQLSIPLASLNYGDESRIKLLLPQRAGLSSRPLIGT
uniref:(northern house mosquito) hypothetical protein n=1 Tax=Culex pipiens TaxID=7175 RepID=A0A8D8A5D1_CULPI